jgi:hypothetical protein
MVVAPGTCIDFEETCAVMIEPNVLIARAMRINVQHTLFRHDISEERVVDMLVNVLQSGRWRFPPPLVVQFDVRGEEWYWVLDGHHRISVARTLSGRRKKSPQLWCFVIDGKEYSELIQHKFKGVEPRKIGAVREYVVTPYGTANLADENWDAIKNFMSRRRTNVNRPLYIYELHGGQAKSIGHFNLRIDTDRDLVIRDVHQTTKLVNLDWNSAHRIKLPPVELEFSDRKLDMSLQFSWDPSSTVAGFKVKEKGLRLSPKWLGASTSAMNLSAEFAMDEATLHGQLRQLRLANRFKEELTNDPQYGVRMAIDKQLPAFLIAELAELLERPSLGIFDPPRGEYKMDNHDTESPK